MKNNNKQRPKNNKTSSILIFCMILILAIVAVLTYAYFTNQNKEEKDKVSYTQLLRDIEDGLIENIEMTVGSTTLKITYKEREKEEDKEKVIVPNVQAFVEYLHQKKTEGIEVELIEKSAGFFTGIRANFLSLISTGLMIAIVIMIFKMQGLGDKGKVYDGVENKSDVTFADVARTSRGKTRDDRNCRLFEGAR